MLKVPVKQEVVLPKVSAVAKSVGKPDVSFSDVFGKETVAVAPKPSGIKNDKVAEKPEKFASKNYGSDTENVVLTDDSSKSVANDKPKGTSKVTSGKDVSSPKKDLSENSVSTVTEEKENISDEANSSILMPLAMNLVTDISKEINVNEEVVKDYIVANNLNSETLLDINSWKSLVTEVNELKDISAILTNETAFDSLKNISNVLEGVNTEDMEQLAARLTEGAGDNKIADLFEKTLESADTVKVEKELPKPQEGIKEETSQTEETGFEEVGKVDYVPETMSEDTGNFTNESKDKASKSTPKLQNSSIAGKLFDNIVASVNELGNKNLIPESLAANIIKQVTSQISNLHAPDRTTLEFMLTPATLGKVIVNVSSKSGVLQAEIKVTTPEAKAVLESQIADLKLNFENRGLKVENVSIMLSETGIGNENGDKGTDKETEKKSSKRSSKISSDDGIEETAPVSETENPVYIDGTGSNVNFSA